VSALLWCAIAGDVVLIVAGNIVFKQDGTPIGLDTLHRELSRIRSEELQREFASRRLWQVDLKEIQANTPMEGRQDRDELVREHTGQERPIQAKQQARIPSCANG